MQSLGEVKPNVATASGFKTCLAGKCNPWGESSMLILQLLGQGGGPGTRGRRQGSILDAQSPLPVLSQEPAMLQCNLWYFGEIFSFWCRYFGWFTILSHTDILILFYQPPVKPLQAVPPNIQQKAKITPKTIPTSPFISFFPPHSLEGRAKTHPFSRHKSGWKSGKCAESREEEEKGGKGRELRCTLARAGMKSPCQQLWKGARRKWCRLPAPLGRGCKHQIPPGILLPSPP